MTPLEHDHLRARATRALSTRPVPTNRRCSRRSHRRSTPPALMAIGLPRRAHRPGVLPRRLTRAFRRDPGPSSSRRARKSQEPAAGRAEGHARGADARPPSSDHGVHDNGTKKDEGATLAGIQVGKWSYWREDGSLLRVGSYSRGTPPELATFEPSGEVIGVDAKTCAPRK